MNESENDLVLKRLLAAPRAAIWRCWTEPDLLVQWFCPKPWNVSEARIELRPGGQFSTVMNGPEGERFDNIGVFLEILPGERLIFTDAFEPGWRPAGKPFMAASVTLSDAEGGGTDYEARAMHWNAETKAEHEAMGFHTGWGMAADQLEALAKTL
ncbi:SRPBCC family protein [Paracoccus sp. CPCC 101403]|uniref:SRPBCC family protein n=2 Tax=Paracoccus broussonetiae TaxID=3075834 RepID=A0ABU3E8S0_9RHOB|nr:SRPBCC family protein [Paracoccus sp. CPCC 101403]MDT1060617.1 SRPBCC family protein [Paracoccus sp. CPCC 101403]